MAQLIVRNIAPELVRQLKRVAAEHGHSAEQEHREILRLALEARPGSKPELKTLLLAMPEGEALFERTQDPGRDVAL